MTPCRLRRSAARALAFLDLLSALRARDFGRAVLLLAMARFVEPAE